MSDPTGGESGQDGDGVDLGIEGIEDAVEIGIGGFGRVYRARQPAFGRTVAVKVLSVTKLDDKSQQRFERECQAMGALSGHPNIVTVFDAGTTSDGRPYLIMEHMSGGSLDDRIRREGAMSWQEAAEVGAKVSAALQVAHEAGIIHRDIKPANILISQYDEPQLGDFGIARITGGQETRSGVITASMAHASPEVLDGGRPSAAADVYAVGSTMFELLRGTPAFFSESDETNLAMIKRIYDDPIPDLRPQGVPEPVAQVLERTMAKRPEDRPASAMALADELQAAMRAAGDQAGAEAAEKAAAATGVVAAGGAALVVEVDDDDAGGDGSAGSSGEDAAPSSASGGDRAGAARAASATTAIPAAGQAGPPPGARSFDAPPPGAGPAAGPGQAPPPPGGPGAPPPGPSGGFGGPPPGGPTGPQPVRKQGGGAGKVLAIVGGVLLVLVLIGAAIFVFTRDDGDGPGPDPSVEPTDPPGDDLPEADAPDSFDDDALDALGASCEGGDLVGCDVLYAISPVDSDAEAYGSTCGGRNDEVDGECSTEYDWTLPAAQDPGDLGADDALDRLVDECQAGDLADCDDLYFDSPIDSDYEAYGATCGGRLPAAAVDEALEVLAGNCNESYGDADG